MKEELRKTIEEILGKFGTENRKIDFDVPLRADLGDYSTNVAMAYAKQLGKKPLELAEEIKKALEDKKIKDIAKIEVAPPGFINFFLEADYFGRAIKKILTDKDSYGKNKNLEGQKIMVEFTDPNPFKEFHIGHLMSNSIGEAISRIIEWSGAKVLRANWQGDVGMHVAKAVWGMKELGFTEVVSIEDLGKAYAYGSGKSEENDVKGQITEINGKIFSREDDSINKLYDMGRQVSLDYFDIIYKRLDTKFDYYFFESKEGIEGKPIVEEYLTKGVFEKSQGAVVFPGEKYGLHTRVFINSNGLPTYEAKELGLNRKKFLVEPELSRSIIVTGNEIREYFKVLLKVISLIFPEIAEKTKHLPHGMLRLPSGKMSSRTGDVITAEHLIEQVKEKIREYKESSPPEISEIIAIGAIKYSILRQAIGGDIIFDFNKSISFEGDSGPYLQYAAVRSNSLLKKAKEFHLAVKPPSGKKVEVSRTVLDTRVPNIWETTNLERLLERFPDVVERAGKEYAPHHIVTYLIELAGEFNSFYASHKIIDEKDETSPYRLALTQAFANVMNSGLNLLGIKIPSQM